MAHSLKKPNSSRKTYIYVIRRLRNKALKALLPKTVKISYHCKTPIPPTWEKCILSNQKQHHSQWSKACGNCYSKLNIQRRLYDWWKVEFWHKQQEVHYKLLNWELNRHVHLMSTDSSTNFIFLTNIVKSWTSYATNRRYYTFIMHSGDYREVHMFQEWEE